MSTLRRRRRARWQLWAGLLTLGWLNPLLGCVPEGPASGDDPGGAASALPAPLDSPSSGHPAADPSAMASGASPADPWISTPFVDHFERAQLGLMWHALSPAWRIEDGELCAQGANNRGVWLRQRVPMNARISFDASSHSDDGDIKAELWGDGKSGASGASYDDASGYLVIFGGWNNSLSVLARLDEHKRDRQAVRLLPGSEDFRERPVEKGQRYRFEIERRDGRSLRWSVDGTLIHRFADPTPLRGDGHDHFGFNDWAARVCFDNLSITALGTP